jgi:hypothetical protein
MQNKTAHPWLLTFFIKVTILGQASDVLLPSVSLALGVMPVFVGIYAFVHNRLSGHSCPSRDVGSIKPTRFFM